MVIAPVRGLFPQPDFLPEVCESSDIFSQFGCPPDRVVVAARLSVGFSDSGLQQALHAAASRWTAKCTEVSQKLRVWKTVEVCEGVWTDH
jgi:hypothetical protein